MTLDEACKKIEDALYATEWLLETQPTNHAFLAKCALMDLCKELGIWHFTNAGIENNGDCVAKVRTPTLLATEAFTPVYRIVREEGYPDTPSARNRIESLIQVSRSIYYFVYRPDKPGGIAEQHEKGIREAFAAATEYASMALTFEHIDVLGMINQYRHVNGLRLTEL